MNKSIKNKKAGPSGRSRGFALIELLIVIFIIALLAALILAATHSARERGRDGRRKADLDSMKKAIELYRSDNGGNVPGAPCIASACLSSSAQPWIPGLAPTYIGAVLTDPTNSGSHIYRYQSTATGEYELDTDFENSSNDSLENNDNGSCNSGATSRYEVGTVLTIITAACL